MPTFKLFENPDVATIGDTSVIVELNKRLAQNSNYKIPEGFLKVAEKEVISVYKIPDYFPVKRPQKIVLEILDKIFADALGVHFLEPMSEVKEVWKAKMINKHVSEGAEPARYMQPSKPRARSRMSRD
jgi:hypothetical protein